MCGCFRTAAHTVFEPTPRSPDVVAGTLTRAIATLVANTLCALPYIGEPCPLPAPPTVHYFAASKAEWHEMHDNLPQFAER